jgi:hypothetical protein
LDQAHQLVEKESFDEAGQNLEKALLWPENLGVGKPYHPNERMVRFAQAALRKVQGHSLDGVASSVLDASTGPIEAGSLDHALSVIAYLVDPTSAVAEKEALQGRLEEPSDWTMPDKDASLGEILTGLQVDGEQVPDYATNWMKTILE